MSIQPRSRVVEERSLNYTLGALLRMRAQLEAEREPREEICRESAEIEDMLQEDKLDRILREV